MSSTRRFLYICSSKLNWETVFPSSIERSSSTRVVKCCCMFLWVGLAVFVKLFMYILPPDLWFQSLTVFLCWCFILFKKENVFLSAACQTYCISKDVKVYFSFWKTIKYHHVRKKPLLVSPVISVSSPHLMEESLRFVSETLGKCVLKFAKMENIYQIFKDSGREFVFCTKEDH